MKNKINRKLNIIILLGVMAVSLLVMILEGYLKVSLSSKPFLIFGGIIIVFNFYVILFQISTKRLITLIPIAGAAGYVTQVIGTGCNIWVYTNHGKTFYIAIFMFIFAANAMYGITVMMSPLSGKHGSKEYRNSIFNICWVSGIFLFLVVTSLRFRNDINLAFWVYYGFLFIFAIYSSSRLSIRTMVSLTISAWVVGFASEYFGSQAGIWLFEKSDNFPPAFLVGGSWPLEFTLHYCLSAVISKEKC
jgi:hypothetical protein